MVAAATSDQDSESPARDQALAPRLSQVSQLRTPKSIASAMVFHGVGFVSWRFSCRQLCDSFSKPIAHCYSRPVQNVPSQMATVTVFGLIRVLVDTDSDLSHVARCWYLNPMSSND